jgi:AcrR family transcriptional regulator
VSTPQTRDRILDAAMRLFGDNGFRGTSITAIETEAGLTPGAGGIYHHFKSKEALLTAGIERQLGRLGALRDIRRIFSGLGDPRAELTLIARYALAELDSETELLRILFTEARARPQLVGDAVNTLVTQSYGAFAGWLRDTGGFAEQRAGAVAAVALGGLLANRMTRTMLGEHAPAVEDDTFVATWVDMVLGVL